MASPEAGSPPSTGTAGDSELTAGGPKPWRGTGRSSGTSAAPACEVLCGRVHPPLLAELRAIRLAALAALALGGRDGIWKRSLALETGNLCRFPLASTHRQRFSSPAPARGRFLVHLRRWVSPIRRRQPAGPADQQSHHGSRRDLYRLTTSPCRPTARLASTRGPRTSSPAPARGAPPSDALRSEKRITTRWGHHNTEPLAPALTLRWKQEPP